MTHARLAAAAQYINRMRGLAMVMKMTPRWGRPSDTDDASSQSQDPDQSTNAGQSTNSGPPSWSAPANASSAAAGSAAANGATGQSATASGLHINLIQDDSVASAPAGFVTAIEAAAAVYQQAFPGLNITLNIRYGWGSFDNITQSNLTAPGSNGAEGGDLNGSVVSYSTLKGWLTANVNSVADATMVASLPASINSQFYVPSAEEKALGVLGDSTAVDGAIGFGTSSQPWFWEEAAIHEIGHALGRETAYYDGGTPVVLDLMRYSSPGNLHWTGVGAPDYFSIDGGGTDLANFDTTSDYSDFAVDNLTPADPFDFQVDGSVTTLTPLDIEVMNVLGFEVPLSSGQTLDILSGQGSRDLTLLSGSTLFVFSGGTASGEIDSGLVAVFGVASGTTVDSGGVEILASGGSTTATVVNSGGVEEVAGGGTATGLVVNNGGIDVVIGGTEIGTTVNTGGLDLVGSGGVANRTSATTGGVLLVAAGGTASGAIITSSGVDYVDGTGATGSGASVNGGGLEVVFNGGVANGTLLGGGGIDLVEGGGVANRVSATSGLLLVASGGTVSGATITSGSVDLVDGAGATGSAAVIVGAVEEVVSGGTATGTILGSGGVEIVGTGGAAHGLIVGSGGIDLVVSGGTQTGTVVSSGGVDFVVSGTASGAIVVSGGFEVVSAGSVDSGVTISGGVFDVASGGSIGSGPVTFASGGMLVLDASQTFDGLVAGFRASDYLDLKDIGFGPGASLSFTEAGSNQSGTLTVTDSTHTAHIELLGNYAAASFISASDGGAGTLIADPAAGAGPAAVAAIPVSSHQG
jgi:autotransporter passenger strand-loop-strand repeat protein